MIKSINPSNGKLIEKFNETSEEKILHSVEKSRIAQEIWAKKSKEDRIAILLEIKKSFEINREKLINTVNEECGFDKEEVQNVFYDVLDGFDYYTKKYLSKKSIEFPLDQNVYPESTSEIKFYPHGVIAQIGVWNYPLWQTMITVIPALVTGNSILYKPSEKSTKTGLLISEIINSTKDIPKDLFIPIIGGAKEGQILVSSDVDAIIYTGNIKTGKKIIKSAGIKPVLLELSGNDSAIVCKDCDLNQTIEGIVGGSFIHSGEVCDRIKRIYVVKDIADSLIEGLIKKTETVKDKITPLISKEALNKVDKQVKKNLKNGAEVLVGGKKVKKEGFYYEPTFLKLKKNNHESIKDEIFGPVTLLFVVDSEEEAIKLANSTEFGLGTSIWTQNFEKANRILDKCETGMIWINDSNIPLICGEYFKGWKSTSIPNSSDRLGMFQKSKTIISFNSNKKRSWWL